jgi:hypothetical protein
MGWTARIRFPVGAKDISLLHSVQTGPGIHPDSNPRGLKWPGCEADHSPPSIAEVKNDGAIPPFLHKSSWRVA